MLDTIVELLRPDTIGDFFIYVIFFLSMLLLFVTPEKNDTPNYLTFIVLFACVLDLLRGNPSVQDTISIPEPWGLSDEGFFTYLLHIVMFVFPLIAGGMTRRKGRKGGAALPVALLIGLIAGVYAIGTFLAPDAFYSAI